MKYRSLSPDQDYVFGQGAAEILSNTPEAVAQAVKTRLRLATGDWFLDLEEGTPYSTAILGFNKQTVYDAAIQTRILETNGVQSIDAYQSSLDSERALSVQCTITTIYGVANLAASVTTPPKTGKLDSTFVLDHSALA